MAKSGQAVDRVPIALASESSLPILIGANAIPRAQSSLPLNIRRLARRRRLSALGSNSPCR
jgi:hypothetical protein